MLRHVDLNNHHPPRLKGFIRELTLRANSRAIAWRAKVRRRNKSLGTYLISPDKSHFGTYLLACRWNGTYHDVE